MGADTNCTSSAMIHVSTPYRQPAELACNTRAHLGSTLLAFPGPSASTIDSLVFCLAYQLVGSFGFLRDSFQVPQEWYFVGRPFATQEHEPVQVGTPADERDLFQLRFQHDVQRRVVAREVGEWPEVPVRRGSKSGNEKSVLEPSAVRVEVSCRALGPTLQTYNQSHNVT